VAALAALLAAGCGGAASTTATSRTPGASGHAKAAPNHSVPATALSYRPLYHLASAVQDPAAAALGGGRFVLMGGLTAADSSTANVVVGDRTAAQLRTSLPNAQHDAQAAALSGLVYLFGGGQFTQYGHILSYDAGQNAVTSAGQLPAPASDVAVAGDGSRAYIVGGYDGSHSLDTVLSWQPGGSPRTVARLPVALRYAAAAVAGGRLLVVGGSTPDGNASDAIFGVDLTSGQVTHLGRLPQPLTHAGAAVLGTTVYIVGGRGANTTSQSATVWAINPRTGAVRRDSQLPQPLSDAGVLALGNAIVVAGGRTQTGTQTAVGELAPTP
jgi:hypothetical protein